MKKFWCMILVLALAASFAGAALAEAEPPTPPADGAQVEEPKEPTGDEESSLPEDGDSSLTRYGAAKGATISVSGNATILVPADTATVRLGVTESAQNVLECQNRGHSPSAARKRHRRKVHQYRPAEHLHQLQLRGRWH